MTSQDTHSVWSRMNGPHSQSVSHLAPNAIQRATLHSARWPPRSCRAGDPRRHWAESDNCYAGPPGLPDGPRVRPRRVGAGAFFDPASALIGVPMGDARLPSVGDSPGINAAENHRSSQSSESPRRFASRRAGPIAGSAGHGATHPLGWRLPAPSSSPGIAESAPGRTPAGLAAAHNDLAGGRPCGRCRPYNSTSIRAPRRSGHPIPGASWCKCRR